MEAFAQESKMVKRNLYDMSHYSHMAGKMGHLQTLSVMPVVAGESWSFNIEGVTRQNALRRDIIVDALSDVFLFYMPYRRVYGEDFKTFMKDGINETVNFPNGPLPTNGIDCLGAPRDAYDESNAVPYHVAATYNQIWNWFFRIRSDQASEKGLTDLPTQGDERTYGYLISRLPSQWSEIMNSNSLPDASDRQVSTSGNVLDLIDLATAKGNYESEIMRSWFGREYPDLIEAVFDGKVSDDAEDKPTLIWHDRRFMSGRDVDGTDETTLGSFSGKSVVRMDINIPRKFMPEHGLLWLCQSVRFPTMHEHEMHYLTKKQEMDYLEISGDPQIWPNLPPERIDTEDVFENGNTTELGYNPYGHWLRSQPSIIHRDFEASNGFPILLNTPGSFNQAAYHVAGEYDQAFQSTQFGHWRSQLRIGAEKVSPVPEAIRSIYAGV